VLNKPAASAAKTVRKPLTLPSVNSSTDGPREPAAPALLVRQPARRATQPAASRALAQGCFPSPLPLPPLSTAV